MSCSSYRSISPFSCGYVFNSLSPSPVQCIRRGAAAFTIFFIFVQNYYFSTATTPVKTSPESPTAPERPRTTNAGSGQNPPTKVRQRTNYYTTHNFLRFFFFIILYYSRVFLILFFVYTF